ncbi:hypothetical protein ACHAW6_004429, partial [Cyclotella cf. meneghiniana]
QHLTMGFFNNLKNKVADEIKGSVLKELGLGGDPEPLTQEKFEETKPDELRKDIRMISGCADHQTSADVSNVSSFQLPDPAGRAGGALTSTLLKVLYADERKVDEDLSFTEVLMQVRNHLSKGKYTQIPQLSSMNPIDVGAKFDLVPDTATGTRRAVMIGINYVGDNPGELRGCWNDVLNMKKYIMDVHGFDEENITVLLDDGDHVEPTYANIVNAYKKVIEESSDGDAIFLHYSGHGTKLRDDDRGEEADGYDEALCPRDFASAGMLRDDDLYDILVKGCPDGVHMVSLMDCCHSGTIMDLPYVFRADGEQTEMILDPEMNIEAFIQQITGKLVDFLERVFKS